MNKTIRNAKRSYYANLFEKSKTSAKDTSAAIKVIINSNSNQTKFPKYFQINDMRVIDKNVIANQFNDFFVNIGSKLAQTIPSVDTHKTVNSYLINKTSSAISLLPTISKVFEKVVQEQLTEFLNVNKLLYNSQYGFRKAHSTETATLELIDTLLQTLDKTDIPISIFFGYIQSIRYYRP